MASHSIAYASSLLNDAWRPPSTQYTHSPPFNPVSVQLKQLIVPPHECGVCLRVACRQGRREIHTGHPASCTVSVLVAKGRAQVSVAASSGDWSKRIRDMQYTDHEDYTVGS